MLTSHQCYCGANKSFAHCCQPFIEPTENPHVFPQTPEQLMRSRFSAYVIGKNQYIYDTYAKKSRVLQSIADITAWGESCTWVALQIHSNTMLKNKHESTLPEQFVEFSAFYITDNTLFELRENSRFIIEAPLFDNNEEKEAETQSSNVQWRYIDGDIIKHDKLIKIKRNDLCPCNIYPTAWSIKKGKKFKQCCGK